MDSEKYDKFNTTIDSLVGEILDVPTPDGSKSRKVTLLGCPNPTKYPVHQENRGSNVWMTDMNMGSSWQAYSIRTLFVVLRTIFLCSPVVLSNWYSPL